MVVHTGEHSSGSANAVGLACDATVRLALCGDSRALGMPTAHLKTAPRQEMHAVRLTWNVAVRSALCGDSSTLGISHSGLSFGSGSVWNTSSAAPCSLPCCSAVPNSTHSRVGPAPLLPKHLQSLCTADSCKACTLLDSKTLHISASKLVLHYNFNAASQVSNTGG